MTERFVAANLDLSNLPPPEVIKDVSYDAILADRLASLKTRWPDLDTTALETEPAVILQQEDAYREVLAKAAINDAARSVMLAFATGANLDHLALLYGVVRLLIREADADAGTPAVYESDGDLRRRAQLAPEALPYAGLTGGGYRSLALKTASSLKDVSTVKRSGGRVDVVLLGRDGDGAVSNEVVSSVYNAFQDDESTQLTDIVAVRAADIVTYSVNVKLVLRLGPDPAAVKAFAEAALRAHVTERHRVGRKLFVTGLIAAAQVGNVEQVVIQGPMSDIDPGAYGAAFCISVTVTTEISG